MRGSVRAKPRPAPVGRGCPFRAMPTITVLIDSPPTTRCRRRDSDHAGPHDQRASDRDSFTIDVVHTDAIDTIGDAVVIGPGTPYNDPRAAEDVITSARARGVPLVAT